MSAVDEPIHFLCDENFDRLVVEEVRKKVPALDIRTAADEGILGLQDPDVLAYAADHGRILLTGDIHTMPEHFDAFLAAGRESPGVLLIPQTLSVGRAVNAILLVWGASSASEWRNLCIRPPY